MTATTARGPAPADAEVWLSVQDASAMLGVSPATLRRWSAAGEVDAYTTPGGHRRFALSALRALLARPEAEPAGLPSLGESPERMIRSLRRNALVAGRGSPWVRGLDPATRAALRRTSGVLTEGLLAALTAACGPALGAPDDELWFGLPATGSPFGAIAIATCAGPWLTRIAVRRDLREV